MFIGEYQHTIDEKGRLAIPVKFRKLLGKIAVVTKGLDDCLFLYTQKEFKKEVADKLAGLSFAKANNRALSRHMLAGAMDAEIDGQGRVMIPEYLRNFAKMKKNVVMAGLYNRIEIWDEETWEKNKKNTESQSGNIAEALGGLGV
ncbi:MAG: Protein MraZ [Parcubacteria group bacterium GW2011_GWA2_38_13]|nr:MAG: Protein MraZ [Parcubacteria group bacterium GW2011_GWA2_38_13]